ncbi:MAG: DUF4252 domain-containing protein [Saprospiraceae bacterium]|nr:DUF4252 domain-containing protein [Saprospiraceae bacterium]
MKNLLRLSFAQFFIAFCLFTAPLSIMAQNNAVEKFFNQYMDDEAFTVVHVTPKMFQMIAKLDIKDKDYGDAKAVLQDLKGLWILSTENNAKAPQLYKEATSKINTNEYELLMTVRDKGDNVRFWTKESNGTINELLMLVGEANEFTLISFVGKIDLDKISKLSNKIDIDGMEHLKKVKDKND